MLFLPTAYGPIRLAYSSFELMWCSLILMLKLCKYDSDPEQFVKYSGARGEKGGGKEEQTRISKNEQLGVERERETKAQTL